MDDVQFLDALSRQGSLAGAAEVTQRTKAEVASGIHRLEEAYGAMLVERGPEGYRLTRAGKRVLKNDERRRPIVSGETQADDIEWTSDEPLRISMDDAFAALHLPDLVAVAERYPKLHIEVRVQNDSISFDKAAADLAVVCREQPPKNRASVRAGLQRFAPFAARDLVDEIGRGAPLIAYPWIARDPRRPRGKLLEEALAKLGVEDPPTYRIDSPSAVLTAVKSGLGAALLERTIGEGNGDLVPLAGDVQGCALPIWITVGAAIRFDPVVDALVRQLVASIARIHPLPGDDEAPRLPRVERRVRKNSPTLRSRPRRRDPHPQD